MNYFFFYFAEAAFDLFYLHIRQINFILLYLFPINFGIFHINKLVLFFPKKKKIVQFALFTKCFKICLIYEKYFIMALLY